MLRDVLLHRNRKGRGGCRGEMRAGIRSGGECGLESREETGNALVHRFERQVEGVRDLFWPLCLNKEGLENYLLVLG